MLDGSLSGDGRLVASVCSLAAFSFAAASPPRRLKRDGARNPFVAKHPCRFGHASLGQVLILLYPASRTLAHGLHLVHLLRICWLPVASFFAGVLNTIAGGGSFLSLPALFAGTTAAGVGAVTAQATNTVALWPGQLTSLVAFRQQLRAYGWKLAPLGIASGVGGWMGGSAAAAHGEQAILQGAAAVAAVVCRGDVCAELSAWGDGWPRSRAGSATRLRCSSGWWW
jgi:hypothetical protein